MKFLFDSSALIAYLNTEPSADRVESLLRQVEAGKIQGLISVVTLTEIIYLFGRLGYRFVSFLENSRIGILGIDADTAKRAGGLRLQYRGKKLSIADCLIIAGAIEAEADYVVSLDNQWKDVQEVTVYAL